MIRRPSFRKGSRVRVRNESSLPAELHGRTAIVLRIAKDFAHLGFPGTSWAPPHYSFVEPIGNLSKPTHHHEQPHRTRNQNRLPPHGPRQ